MRKVLFLVTLVSGLCLAALGFALAAPIGPTDSPVHSNPRVIFAPGLFVLGVMLIFLSAVVYELVPERRR